MGKMTERCPMCGRENRKMMVRCPMCGRENYCTMVLLNVCAWCGWDDTDKKYLPRDTDLDKLYKERNKEDKEEGKDK